ncbi:MAG TPA: serine/threonine-protein kinase, partial [Planctomycetota bacterium]|nr:serine/threonine-protein kinase [Planctomycetota bacterium]
KSGDVYFSRMELIEGKTLLELLEAGQAFDETRALRIVLEVADVLAYLTTQNVIHRDVKPGNIMLGANGRMRMIDLGFAGAPDQAPKDEETTVGTVQYLSPEQARGGATADMRGDIYSLGVTLFHLVVGRLPFESSDNREVLRMQVMESLRSPELKGRGLSHHLQYFIEKMMAKSLDARYQSWDELMSDIRSQIEGRESLDFSKDARRPRGPGAQPGRR